MTLSWISVFLESQAADFGAARNTQEAYGRDLKDFLAYLEARDAGFATATRAMVEDYLVHCDAAGLASATKARRLSSIKQLYRFAFEEELRKDNPAIQVKGPGKGKSLPKSLDHDEVDRLLLQARQMPQKRHDKLRLTCLMELLYATGMRVTELVSLPAEAVRGDPQMILVRGKGGKERMVPMSTTARAATQLWLTLRDSDPQVENPPFSFPHAGNWAI